jgi:hypothetical protein
MVAILFQLAKIDHLNTVQVRNSYPHCTSNKIYVFIKVCDLINAYPNLRGFEHAQLDTGRNGVRECVLL